MTPSFPSLSRRIKGEEWMDDFSTPDGQLIRALKDLRQTNHFLGGHASSDAPLEPFLREHPQLRVLDLACGGGDYLCHLVRRGVRFNCTVHAVGLDANPVVIEHARSYLDGQLSPSLRKQVRVDVGDALSPAYEPNAFDIVHASLFLHHLHGQKAVQLLRTMHRFSRIGLVVNDLHRHLLAYAGFWLFSHLFRLAPMARHDGLISVRRGFRRQELKALAAEAGIPSPSIQWHWAFRWTLSTLPDDD